MILKYIDQLTNYGKKSIQQISNDILLYKYANKKILPGLVRRRNFEKNLFDTPVQGNINNNNFNKNQSNEKILEIAKEVIKGKWGVGNDRKRMLENAGYNYKEVQNLVNALMK